jgi:anti-anti-sigma regulatory factor
MAMNFRIFHLRSSNSVHLTLDGDFDGTSAYELLNTLSACGKDVDQIFINTNGLKSIHPFGQVVLYRNISDLGSGTLNLVFLGEYRHKLPRPWVQ